MKRNLNWLDRVMLAVTFAEAGCPELAADYATSAKGADKRRIGHGPEACANGRQARMVRLAAQR